MQYDLSVGVQIIDESTIQRCESEIKKFEYKDLHEALNDMCDKEGRIDVRVIKFILDQKDCVIDELKDKVKILTDQVSLLKHMRMDASFNNSELSNEVDVPPFKRSINRKTRNKFKDNTKMSTHLDAVATQGTNVDVSVSGSSRP